VRTVFESGNYHRHKLKHPELENPSFFPESVRLTIRNPGFIYRSHNDPNSLCLYRENGISNLDFYTKVVIKTGQQIPETGEHIQYVKTAFSINAIRESKYGRPAYSK
jgi:hypothetical protein